MTTETLDHLRSQLSAASDYPHEVEHFTFESQQQELSMAYMDVVAQSKDRHQSRSCHQKQPHG